MSSNKQGIVSFFATKIDFDYTISIEGTPDICQHGTVIVHGIAPSVENIQEAVNGYVGEKAVTVLSNSAEASVNVAVVITNSARISTNVTIRHAH